MKYSQKQAEPPFKPWIILSCEDRILAYHCNCVAGLEEVSIHLSSVLFIMGFLTDDLTNWTGPSKKDRFCNKLPQTDFKTSDSEEEEIGPEPIIPKLTEVEKLEVFKQFEALNMTAACMVPYLADKKNSK